MKTYCFECKHDCHCGRKCNQCSCYICNNIVIKTYEDYMGGNIIRTFFRKWLIGLFIIFLLFLYSVARADTVTTGNLLPNAGDGVDWGSNSTDQINPGNSGYVNNGDVVNGFTVTCSESQANCGYKHSTGGDFEVTGTATVSVDDIDLTSNTITQDMLDNGITLNSYIDVANCDSKPGNCEGRSGDADSHTIIIELKDSDGNILSTTTQTRVDISGFQGNCNGYPYSNSGGQTADCGQYNDQVIYNDTGSNKVDWSWSGTDNNNSNSSLGGPNLLGAKLTMTYDDTVIDNSIIEEIEDIFDNIDEDIINDISDNIQEPDFEIDMDSPEFESIIITEEFVEDFYMEMDQEFFIEDQGTNFEDEPMVVFADDQIMEEMYEESNEIIETFLPMPSEEEGLSSEESFVADESPVFMQPNDEPTEFTTETFKEEEMLEEDTPMMTETFKEEEIVEEEPKEMAKEEMIEEEKTEVVEEETTKEKPTKIAKATNEEKKEKVKEKEPTSKTTKTAKVKNENNTKQKNIQSKEAIKANLVKIMDKVDKDIKDISKNLQIKNIIKLDAMANDQVSLDLYDVPFYKSKDIYLDQIQIQDLRQIYEQTTLVKYTATDPINIVNEKLNKINIKKKRLLIELEQLKNG